MVLKHEYEITPSKPKCQAFLSAKSCPFASAPTAPSNSMTPNIRKKTFVHTLPTPMLPDPKRLHIEDNLMEENKAKDNTNVVNGENETQNLNTTERNK